MVKATIRRNRIPRRPAFKTLRSWRRSQTRCRKRSRKMSRTRLKTKTVFFLENIVAGVFSVLNHLLSLKSFISINRCVLLDRDCP